MMKSKTLFSMAGVALLSLSLASCGILRDANVGVYDSRNDTAPPGKIVPKNAASLKVNGKQINFDDWEILCPYNRAEKKFTEGKYRISDTKNPHNFELLFPRVMSHPRSPNYREPTSEHIHFGFYLNDKTYLYAFLNTFPYIDKNPPQDRLTVKSDYDTSIPKQKQIKDISLSFSTDGKVNFSGNFLAERRTERERGELLSYETVPVKLEVSFQCPAP